MEYGFLEAGGEVHRLGTDCSRLVINKLQDLDIMHLISWYTKSEAADQINSEQSAICTECIL